MPVLYEAIPTVSVSEFIPELAFEFPDMPDDAFAHFILRAINRLARASNVLRRDANIVAQRCVETYLLEPQDCVDIVAVMGIRGGPRCNAFEVTRLLSRPAELPCGSYAWLEEPNIIHITRTQDDERFTVVLSVAPTFDACEVDRILLTNFYDVVIDGTKSFLYGMGNKPWSSVARAQEFELKFSNGIGRITLERLSGGQRGVIKRYMPRIL